MKYVITETQYKVIFEDGLDVEPSKNCSKKISVIVKSFVVLRVRLPLVS